MPRRLYMWCPDCRDAEPGVGCEACNGVGFVPIRVSNDDRRPSRGSDEVPGRKKEPLAVETTCRLALATDGLWPSSQARTGPVASKGPSVTSDEAGQTASAGCTSVAAAAGYR
jgi:hypothetical protein